MIEREPETRDKRFNKWDGLWLKEKNDPKFEIIRNEFAKNFLEKEIIEKGFIEKDRQVNPEDILFLRKDFLKQAGIKLAGREFEVPSSTLEGLEQILLKYPQIQDGKARYLLTSGLAVEAITGVVRLHHDTDLVICDEEGAWWTGLLTDNVTPKKYWANMSFPEGFLERTVWEARFNLEDREVSVLTVHPAIILIQKLSNAWGRPPREKDLADVQALLTLWRKLGRPQYWVNLMQKALDALPSDAERATTFARLKDADFLGQIVI